MLHGQRERGVLRRGRKGPLMWQRRGPLSAMEWKPRPWWRCHAGPVWRWRAESRVRWGRRPLARHLDHLAEHLSTHAPLPCCCGGRPTGRWKAFLACKPLWAFLFDSTFLFGVHSRRHLPDPPWHSHAPPHDLASMLTAEERGDSTLFASLWCAQKLALVCHAKTHLLPLHHDLSLSDAIGPNGTFRA